MQAEPRQAVILKHDGMVIPVVERCGIRSSDGAHMGEQRSADVGEYARPRTDV